MKIEELSDEVLLKYLDRIDFAITGLRVFNYNSRSVTVEDLLLFSEDIRNGLSTLAELGGIYSGKALIQLTTLCNRLKKEANKRGLINED